MMTSLERQAAIRAALSNPETPTISANTFAQQFGVSRQTIVGDIALIRATGDQIIATPQGYQYAKAFTHETILVMQHTFEEIEPELTIMVETGLTVTDVQVEHPLYGLLRGELSIASIGDVKQFVYQLSRTNSQPLSALTNGIHMHRVTYNHAAELQNARVKLREIGFLFEN
ncbi:transcription repressor NadR [Weissella soli]|jgi:transcriptional regulator of NAD metabolism|nr:transcription repressor NadR [Weissella soli]MCT8394449.1 HTH domain-containing protein [Weissella soli]QEA35256.1 transcription repressor NadR [Weissella soli]GEN93434.1 transcriptional regulator [Weissella soli]